MFIYRKYTRRHLSMNGLAALISASKDGAFLSSAFKKFGVQPVRGSSSRRGPQALLELTSWVERGYNLAITPDGPRGPRYVVQPGVMALASVTGAPVIPVSSHTTRKLTLRSWDGFQIPLPLARCVVTFAEPIFVPRDISDEERLHYCEELEKRLKAITQD
jgi:lysophospholipid acyltransferase (LPLAT)-like uncharacterized protein